MDGDIGARAARLRPGVLGWGHAVVGLLAAMVCVLLPSLVLMSTGGAQMAAGADGGDLDAMPKLAVSPWMALAQFVPLLIIVALVLRGARRKTVREEGNGAGSSTGSGAARRPGEMAAVESGRFFGPGMLRALLVIGVIAVIIAVVANIFLAVRGEAPNSLAGKLGLGKGAGADLLIIAGAACIGPVAEELAFRGLVFRGVFDALGSRARATRFTMPLITATVISTVTFAIAHQDPSMGQNVFFAAVGAFACIAYWATRSLTSAAWIHSVVNSIALAVAFFWSTDHGTVVHGVALVAAPFVALAVMAALSRFVGVARL